MAFIIRFCCGKLPQDEAGSTRFDSVSAKLKTVSPEEIKPMPRSIAIDCTTMVPEDLYDQLVEAGELARRRGQHRLTYDPRPPASCDVYVSRESRRSAPMYQGKSDN
uniref:Uncharacterized protein n=1 Tax=Noctiluca scintillans TaxID=2966 RepID=A0A7S1F3T0_NOCSC